MAARVAVLREQAAGEHRVAATPETVKKLIALGASVAVEAGAGAVPMPAPPWATARA
jgi:NAD(P) transhydrogenase subunit alpha